jgi:Zn-dependent metalloprotease
MKWDMQYVKKTTNLAYQDQTMNEGFSDIWGAVLNILQHLQNLPE